jgi:hopene-associated glycosyltransferase HpnB
MLGLGVACTVAAVAWVYLAVGHGGYWRTSQWLPSATSRSPLGEPARWPGVVAVIPARNEAVMLPAVLPTLLGQDYPGPLTVIVVDDCSSDGTAAVAAELGPQPGPGPRALRVVAGSPLPPGWAGKVWAMAQGLDAAGLPPGPAAAGADPDPGGPGYVLFTDADIAWDAGALRALVSAAEADDRDLVSQMALLRTATPWERVVVPAFVYFFAQLYPFPRVNAPGSRTAAAAGGCMLVRTEALSRSGGLAPIHGARIDDVAFGRMIKRQRGRCWLGLSTRVVSIRPYPRLADLWRMVSRSAYIQLNYSPWLLAATIAGLLLSYALPPAGAVIGLAALGGLWGGAAAGAAALAAGAGLAGWALMSLTYLPMLRLYRLSPLRAPGLPPIAMLYAAMTVDSARRHYAGRGAEWKGRTDRARLRWPGGRHRGRYSSGSPALGGRAGGGRLAPLPRRRRLHRHSAPGQPARGVPGRARPGRRPHAAHGPGDEPVGDGVLPAGRAP